MVKTSTKKITQKDTANTSPPTTKPQTAKSSLYKTAVYGTTAGLGVGTLGYLAYLKNENPKLFTNMILNLGSVGYDFVKGGSVAAANSVLSKMGIWRFLEESLGMVLPTYAREPIVKAALKMSNITPVPPPVPSLPTFTLEDAVYSTKEPSSYSPLLIEIPDKDSDSSSIPYSSPVFSAMSFDQTSTSPISPTLFESFQNLVIEIPRSPMDIDIQRTARKYVAKRKDYFKYNNARKKIKMNKMF